MQFCQPCLKSHSSHASKCNRFLACQLIKYLLKCNQMQYSDLLHIISDIYDKCYLPNGFNQIVIFTIIAAV